MISPFRWVPQRKKTAHKGDCGRVLIIAGSRGMVGAGVLTASAAVNSGAGLVRLSTVKSQQSVAVKRVPLEVTTAGWPESKDGSLSAGALSALRLEIKKFSPHVIAAGPGLRVTKAVHALVLALLKSKIPLVLDADALNALTLPDLKKSHGPLVFTPHPGELARLYGTSASEINKHRNNWALRAAKETNAICLLKGPGTLVSDGRRVWKNKTGNEKMASGGMGDVLTGVIAALWAQMPAQTVEFGFRSAVVGAYAHGQSADLLQKKSGLSLRASDVAAALPHAFAKMLKHV